MDKINYFNALNNTYLTSENLLCSSCSKWLSKPIFLTPHGKNVCDCTKSERHYRNKPLEIQLKGSQYPCLRLECFTSTSLEDFAEHEKLCQYALIKCPICKDEILDEDLMIEHLLKHKSCSQVEEYVETTPKVILKLKSHNSSDSSVHIIEINVAQLYSKVDESMIPYTIVQKTTTGEVRTKGKVCSMRRMFNKRIVTSHLTCTSMDMTLYFADFENSTPCDNCPICLQPLGNNIYPCVNDHAMCKDCAGKMDKCPHCRSPMQKKSIVLSRILSKRAVRCENVKSGCLVYASNAEHDVECVYKPYDCPWPKCDYRAHQEAIIRHMKQKHYRAMFRMGYPLISNMPKPIFIEHNGNVFEVCIADAYKAITFHVTMCLNDRQAHKYRYVVQFFSTDFRDEHELLRCGNFVGGNVPVRISAESVSDFFKGTNNKYENSMRFKVFIRSPEDKNYDFNSETIITS